MMKHSDRLVPGAWVLVLLLFAIKLVLVSDIPVHIRYSPFDDSLYVTRALAFLDGNAWGRYDPYTLAKLPGISLWLAANRVLGVPYLLGINILYGLAGIYLLRAAATAGVGAKTLVLAYLAYLMNPVTFSIGWALVMREALSSVLTVALLGASLHILVATGTRLSRARIAFWSLLFAFGLVLREEDSLLWGYLFLFALSTGWLRRAPGKWIDRRTAMTLLLVPALLALASGYGLRSYNRIHYGAPMLTDYGEGEFPKLIASIRSIESTTDNRMVMIPQDVLKKLLVLVPELAPVIEALPPPGRLTYSCKIEGVCNEWNSGYMAWWIKQAAAEAGLTPTLPAGQSYFRGVRERIEALCAAGTLSCKHKGSGLLPPMELRWLRAYTQELGPLLSMLLFPPLNLVPNDAQAVNAARSLVQTYHQVTMTSVTENPVPGGNESAPTFGATLAEWRGTAAFFDGLVLAVAVIVATGAVVWRWTMYPGVPMSPLYCLCLVFWIYSAVRLLALAYVAVWFGPYESRIVFSTYTGFSILSFLAIWECRESAKQFRLMRT
jgi:hypothetical protein